MKIKIIIMTMKKIIFKNSEQERPSREKPIRKCGLKRHVRSDGLNRYTVGPLCLLCCVCGFNHLTFLHVCRCCICGCPVPGYAGLTYYVILCKRLERGGFWFPEGSWNRSMPFRYGVLTLNN